MALQIIACIEVVLAAVAALLISGFLQYAIPRIDLYRIVFVLYVALSLYCLAAAEVLVFIITSIGVIASFVGISFAKYVQYANEKLEREWGTAPLE